MYAIGKDIEDVHEHLSDLQIQLNACLVECSFDHVGKAALDRRRLRIGQKEPAFHRGELDTA